MDKVYEELDEVKAEVDRLKAELRAKTDSLENLKKSHNAQVNQIQEARLKAEERKHELLRKEDEIAEANQACQDLKGDLNKKESIIKHLSAANDKLRADCNEKLKKWEDEKRDLLLTLEESNEKAENREQQVNLCRQEIERLEGYLVVSNKKCSESQKGLRASTELRERNDMLQELEEEKRKVEDQLKWKKEQFKHLEEAHQKLKENFRSNKKDWDMEKSTLLDEISSLQEKLDSQIRISDDLKHQLQTCHQALAHVESQKKRLQVEVSDLKARLDDASSEYQDAKSELDCLSSRLEKDIGELRYALKTKDAYLRESKYRIEKLEQENQELRIPLKELQEAQIQEAGATYSQSKLRSKLKNLEQAHKECASTLQVKEAEWKSQLEKLAKDLNSYEFELETKVAATEELKKELERSQSLNIEMELLNEEMSVMLLVLRQGISEAQLNLANYKEEMDVLNRKREEKVLQLMKELEIKEAALISVQKAMNVERERAACLMKEVESFGVSKELQHPLEDELDRHMEMLEESNICQLILKDKVMEMECELKDQLKEVHDALDSANVELDETISVRNEMEFELQIWMSIVERLKNDLEENHIVRRELETSLLTQVDVAESLKQEKDILVYKLEEQEMRIDQLNQELKVRKEITSEMDAILQLEHVKELNHQMETKVQNSDDVIQKLMIENRNLMENVTRLSLERKNLLQFVQGLGDKINEFSTVDSQLMEMLKTMAQSFENDGQGGILISKKDDRFFVNENMLIHSPTSRKKLEVTSDIRSPFKEVNN
ncbi:uncharacterized protein At4g38062 [Arachis duranensis]|uniref:Uncharacterized protein At4g38062 n=1 Tax=Arachis duranensis TaxID=130453 RepID=A0A6P5ND38_ARADU|nr:uncharacterized protein At4g38062 [Arachis duranensis]XP_052114716.1 uncharacterized protein At4g38062 [Arachis duranensis]